MNIDDFGGLVVKTARTRLGGTGLDSPVGQFGTGLRVRGSTL